MFGEIPRYRVDLGLKGWLAPRGWTSGLPPISLLAVVAAMVPLVVKFKRTRS